MSKILFLFIALIVSSVGQAQSHSDFKELKINDAGAAQLKSLLNRDDKSLYYSNDKKDAGKMRLYKAVNQEIKEYIKKGNVLYGDTLSRYLAGIADKLSQSRPSLKGTFKIYLLKSSVCNAFTFPDGTIMVTTGLLARMTSESQVAFILGHELGHLLKKHSEQAFEKNSALKKDFGLSAGNGNVTEVLLHYSREFESEADAIGIELMSAAGFDAKEALKGIRFLSTYDTLSNYSKIDFKKYFNSEDFSVDSLFTKVKDKIAKPDGEGDDKYSTHPDLDKRYIAIKEIFDNTPDLNTKPFPQDSSNYAPIRYMAGMETILAAFEAGNLSESLYLSLRALNSDPSNSFLKLMVARNLIWLANYRDNNALSNAISEDDTRYGIHFMELQKLLKNLTPNDFKKLAYSYMKHNYKRGNKDEEMSFYMAYVSDFYLGSGISRFYFSQYLKDYPNGKYVVFAENKLK